MSGKISQVDFVELVERAGLKQKQIDFLRLYVGLDGPRRKIAYIVKRCGTRRTVVMRNVRKALDQIHKLPFVPAGIPKRFVCNARSVKEIRRPTMMSKKHAERIIGGPVAVGERENGFVRVACYDPFGEVISETGRNDSSALIALVKANYSRAREFVFKRDNYRCTNCGGFRNLQADHIKSRGSDGRHDNVGNLTTLCEGCHRIRHKAKAFYGPGNPRPDRRPEPSDPADEYPDPGPYTWAEMLEEEERLESGSVR